MTLLRFLFPADHVGVGDLIWPVIAIAVWLLILRPRPTPPVSQRCLNRVRLEIERRERMR